MKVVCASETCKYASEKEDTSKIILLNFPNDETSKVWAQNCGRLDLMSKTPEELHLNYYICAEHIEDKLLTDKSNSVLISQNDIPTVFTVQNTRDAQVDTNDCIDLSYSDTDKQQNVGELCRFCGYNASEGIEIFGKKGHDLALISKITLTIPIQVRSDDKLPQKMCSNCYDRLEDAYNLIITCIETENKLKQILKIQENPPQDKFSKLIQDCTIDLSNDLCLEGEEAQQGVIFDVDKNNEVLNPELPEVNLSIEILPNSSVLNTSTELQDNCTSIDAGNNLQNLEVLQEVEKDYQTCLTCKAVFQTKEILKKHEVLCSKKKNTTKNHNNSTISASTTKEVENRKTVLCESKATEVNVTKKNDWIKIKSIPVKRRCGHCNDIFSSRKDIHYHMAQNHNGKKLFGCGMCDRTFQKWSNLDVHEATHRQEKPYLCDQCGKSFKHSNNLRGHKRIHLEESKKKRHICDVCGNAFRSRFHLREHMNFHQGNRPYSCEQCGKAFFKRIQLRQHKLSHGVHKYTCPICGMTFNRRGNMNTHVKRHNKTDGTYTCSVCNHKCNSMSALKIHRKEHSEQEIIDSVRKRSADLIAWQCKLCPKVFPKRESLLNHERGHSTEKLTVECDECGKQLSSKSSLAYHKKSIHSTERPHMCQFCGDAFISKEARLIHERIHTGERPYVCKICNMQYRCSSNLSQHTKTHLEVRPHICRFCSKGFTRRGALTVHERIHTGLKPFTCDTCGKTFSQKNDMLKHKKTHKEKKVQCECCSESFSTKKELLKHMPTHDSDLLLMQSTTIEEPTLSYVVVPQDANSYALSIDSSMAIVDELEQTLNNTLVD